MRLDACVHECMIVRTNRHCVDQINTCMDKSTLAWIESTLVYDHLTCVQWLSKWFKTSCGLTCPTLTLPSSHLILPQEITCLLTRTIALPLARNGRTHCSLVHAKSCTNSMLAPIPSYSVSLQWQIRCGTDPLVHHGRHFGCTVHALCTVSALLNNGILRMGELASQPEECFTHEEVITISISFFI